MGIKLNRARTLSNSQIKEDQYEKQFADLSKLYVRDKRDKNIKNIQQQVFAGGHPPNY
jgi:hypothetical protein